MCSGLTTTASRRAGAGTTVTPVGSARSPAGERRRWCVRYARRGAGWRGKRRPSPIRRPPGRDGPLFPCAPSPSPSLQSTSSLCGSSTGSDVTRACSETLDRPHREEREGRVGRRADRRGRRRGRGHREGGRRHHPRAGGPRDARLAAGVPAREYRRCATKSTQQRDRRRRSASSSRPGSRSGRAMPPRSQAGATDARSGRPARKALSASGRRDGTWALKKGPCCELRDRRFVGTIGTIKSAPPGIARNLKK